MYGDGAGTGQSDGFVIAVDFGGTKIDVALATTSSSVVERLRLDTFADRGPLQALERAADAAQELTTRAARTHGGTVLGHGAVCPGVITDNGVLLAPNMPGWGDLPFARRMAEALGVDRVAVSNDVRAGALAELRLGALRGADTAIYVSLGTGLAAALIADGRVVPGAHAAAGEIGYTVVDSGAALRPGAAPLEELVGGRALGVQASLVLGEELSTAELFARTDPAAAQIVHRALGVFADAVANLAVFVDPSRLAVGGGVMAAGDIILPVLRSRLAQVVPFPPEIVAAHFTHDASLFGAIALAVDSVVGAIPTQTHDVATLTGVPR